MFTLEAEDIEAEVYQADKAKDRYFIKVTFVGTGMYINSFSVMPSNYGGYWVQPPKHRKGVRWGDTVEFDQSYPLWEIIQRKALDAVERYKNEQSANTQMADKVYDVPEGPINLDDIPDFG